MAIETRSIEYRDGEHLLEGCFAWDAAAPGKRPAVLVAHAWGGCGDPERGRARQLAELGYAGFALDLYGKGRRGRDRDENRRLMQPLMDDRQALQHRMQLAVDEARSQPEVDPNRVAAIGFCFGGLCVLDLARAGARINGVVSFHGLLGSPGNTAASRINAKVLVLHGWDDPMATPEDLVALGNELTSLGADWQAHAYGNAMHAFTNPAANDPTFGTVYQADADRRAWQAMRSFLDEVFAGARSRR